MLEMILAAPSPQSALLLKWRLSLLFWLRRSAEHSEEVDAFLLRDLKVSKVELDELWTLVKKKRLREWKKNRASFGYG